MHTKLDVYQQDVEDAIRHSMNLKDLYYASCHDALLADLSKCSDLSEMPIKLRYIFYEYFNVNLHKDAQKNNAYVPQGLNTQFGYFTPIAINERLYPQEIALLRNLRGSEDFSPSLKSLIQAITQKMFYEISSIDDFSAAFHAFECMDINERISNAYGYSHVFMSVASSISGRQMKNVNIYDAGDQDFSFRAYTPELNDMSPEDPNIQISTNSFEAPSSVNFYGLLHHELIHIALNQLFRSFIKNPSGNPELQADIDFYNLRKKVGMGNTDVMSLYFSDPEEMICYSNQRHIENSFELLKKPKHLCAQPTPCF